MEDKFYFSVVCKGVRYYRAFHREPEGISTESFSLWTTDVKKAVPVSLQFVQWYLNLPFKCDEYTIEKYPK